MLLVQFPVFIALYMLLRDVGIIDFSGGVNTMFLGLLDVSKPGYIISILAGVTQFFQIKLSMPAVKVSKKDTSFKGQLQKSMGVQMRYVMPVFVAFIAYRFSSGMALYWTTSNIFAILHEIFVSRKAKLLYGKRTNSNN